MACEAYDTQAQNFLASIGATMRPRLIGHRPYFPDDKESRDVYRITFTRKARFVGSDGIARDGSRFSVRFGQSIMNVGKVPTVYDVLACLEKSDPGTFEEFCGNFGYDTDSRTAERTWRACVRQWNQVRRFFSADELTALQEIE